MLVDVGWDNGFRLDIDKVLAAVGLHPEAHVDVLVDIPQAPAKDGGWTCDGPPGCITSADDLWAITR